ncbi:MAG: bifunctional demethylmenaquinone methyltransferase/2-methoxy-6-polyprenyl-1,4-benzoquinol methylase UbiE [Desulfosarcina sp.]|nr:bifunctional demethylmenaquinone methyltransferase/2-methoxy-6-polyprenyl-1,4-benzoquinol methylase UbiE [Desulfosarcina sp.]MBC2745125.1 bifunctional demethylmenaquinone methyltransferase/2-methoxy-6-polyprenyl-1,4-benzoquinol methylase UbiE [Desulfosarcina sp.]MBC2768032.1 bifunctional demethylmenaquinone methyltransferase/2-methoxy-6-polyprenyl-1,4-benzoquinol methylase UbiE [Desulfosarcina sp.]
MENRELPFVREMFDSIAPRYDLLNRLLSLHQDVVWRKKMVSAMVIPENGRVLDVACGTGDVAMEICRQKGPLVKVTGIDFSPGMLGLAQKKIRRQEAPAISLLAGNALALPFGEQTFHAVTIAFGIRNIQNKAGALKAFYQYLKPGGMVLVLELASPKQSCLRDAYMAYFQRVLPLVGRLFSKHSFAYSYLPDSVSRFPAPDVFMKIMAEAGFSRITCHRLTLGIANLFVGGRAAEK